MYDPTPFWLSIVFVALAFSVVLMDWYTMYRKYSVGELLHIVNRVFAFFCLAMLAGNVIMVGLGEYTAMLFVALVITLTEIVFLATNRIL